MGTLRLSECRLHWVVVPGPSVVSGTPRRQPIGTFDSRHGPRFTVVFIYGREGQDLSLPYVSQRGEVYIDLGDL